MLKKRVRRSLMACAVLLVWLIGLSCGALAEEELEIRIPVSASDVDCTATLYDPDGNAVQTLELKAGQESAFTLVLKRLETRIYTIKLTNTDTSKVAYDRTVYDVALTMYYKNSDELGSIIEIRPHGEVSATKRDRASFANIQKTTIVQIDPPVKKVVTGNPSTPGVFTFVMKAVSNTAGLTAMPMPNGATAQQASMQITGAGEKEFGVIGLTKAGTYVYTISEQAGNAAGYTYDKAVYTITAVVTEGSRGLEVVSTVTKDGAAATDIVFTNAYSPSAAVSANGSGSGSSAVVTGTSPQTNDVRRLAVWIAASAALLLIIAALIIYIVRSGKKNRRSGR